MAGPVPVLTATLSIQLQVSQAYSTDAVNGVRGITGPVSLGRSIRFQNLTSLPTGDILASQVRLTTITVSASSSATYDLLTAAANVLGDATATFGKCKGVVFWLPTVAEAPSALGITVQASSVNIGDVAASVSNDLILFKSLAAHEIVLATGDIVAALRSQTYWLVDSTHKNIKVTNNDSSNVATLLVGFLGDDA
jgi:hypothetical protein